MSFVRSRYKKGRWEGNIDSLLQLTRRLSRSVKVALGDDLSRALTVQLEQSIVGPASEHDAACSVVESLGRFGIGIRVILNEPIHFSRCVGHLDCLSSIVEKEKAELTTVEEESFGLGVDVRRRVKTELEMVETS